MALTAAFAAWLAAACDDALPTIVVDPPEDAGSDSGAGDEWAPWPPQSGPAGLNLFWSIEAQPPTDQSCDQVDLDRVELTLLHPVVDFETWSPPELHEPCITGKIELPPEQGLAPGRYRYKVTMFHRDEQPFAHEPLGETILRAGQTTTVAGITITQADQ